MGFFKNRMLFRISISFIVFIFVITYISRIFYTWRMPRVTLAFSEEGTFVRNYEMWSTVRLDDQYSGYTATSEFLMPVEDLPPSHRTFAYTGDVVDLDVKSVMYARFEGAIIDLRVEDEGAWIIVGYNPEVEIDDGMDILGTYQRTYTYDSIVPSSAVYQEKGNVYVLTLIEQKGVMGRELVVTTTGVYGIHDEMDGRTAIYVQVNEPIIIYKDREISPGDRVRFYP